MAGHSSTGAGLTFSRRFGTQKPRQQLEDSLAVSADQRLSQPTQGPPNPVARFDAAPKRSFGRGSLEGTRRDTNGQEATGFDSTFPRCPVYGSSNSSAIGTRTNCVMK